MAGSFTNRLLRPGVFSAAGTGSGNGSPQLMRAAIASSIAPSVLALTEDSQITKMVRVCGHEDAGMHLAVS